MISAWRKLNLNAYIYVQFLRIDFDRVKKKTQVKSNDAFKKSAHISIKVSADIFEREKKTIKNISLTRRHLVIIFVSTTITRKFIGNFHKKKKNRPQQAPHIMLNQYSTAANALKVIRIFHNIIFSLHAVEPFIVVVLRVIIIRVWQIILLEKY